MPDFQFLTTSNPEEFKKGSYLKQIRSHAMLSVKHNEQQQQQQRSKPGRASSKPQPSSTAQPGSSTSPPLKNEQPSPVGRPVKFVDYDPTKVADKGSRKRSQQNQDADDEDEDRAVAIIPRKSAKARTRFFAAYADAVLGPRQVGRGADVLNTMPEFSNPKISVWDLKRRFDHIMLTDSMRAFYFPAMDGCRHAFLSTACIKATYADLLDGFVEESPATLYIKEEVYTMIREGLLDPERQADDGMFMCIGQLLAAELCQGEEDVMKTHEQGLERIARHRGSLDVFGAKGLIANAISSTVMLSATFREGQPPTMFRDHLNHSAPARSSTSVPESPIFCPRNDFYTIAPKCSDGTLEILREMREMTDLFVNSERLVRQQTRRDEYPYPRELSSQFWSFHNRMLDLPPSSDPITFYPAGGGGGPDHVYEACRHTAILYSYAIAARVPISTAGQYFERAYPRMSSVSVDARTTPSFSCSDDASTSPSTTCGPLTPTSSSAASSLPAPSSSSTHPSIVILAAIQRTPNVQAAWDDLVGVLLWVTLTATTAARPPPPTSSSRSNSSASFGDYMSGGPQAAAAAHAAATHTIPGTASSPASSSTPDYAASSPGWATSADIQRDYERAKARKALAMTAILCTIKLAFERGEALFPAQRTFLRVQALLQR